RLYDTDNKSYLPANVNGRIFVTTNYVDFDLGNANITDEQGYLSYYFQPDCNYLAGVQKWKGGTYEDACYKNSNITDYLQTTIIGWLNNTIIEPNGDVYYSNQNVTIVTNVSDECFLPITDASLVFVLNHSSNYYQCLDVSSNNGWYNCTWNVSNNPSGWYSIRVNSTRQYYNNATAYSGQSFFHQVDPQLTAAFVTPNSTWWGSTFTFKVNVTDDDDYVNVSLWVRCVGGNITPNDCSPDSEFYLANTSIVYDYINKQVTLTRKFADGANIGNYEWFINASDNYGGFASTGIYTFNVTKRPVYLVYVSGNETNVSRIGANTTLVRVRLFRVGADGGNDEPLNGLPVNFWFTQDGSTWSNTPRSNTTGQSGPGYAEFAFNPSCPATDGGIDFFKTGRQWWNATFSSNTEPGIYYYANTSANFTLYINSTLNVKIIKPDGEYYPVGTNVYTLANVSDECEYVSQASVQLSVSGESISCSNNTGDANGQYSCVLSTSVLGTGDYSEEAIATKNYYEPAYTFKPNAFKIRYSPQLSNQQVTPTSEGWGYNFTFNVSAQDSDPGDYLNISLWKSYGGEWIKVEQKNCDSCLSQQTIFFHPIFSCEDYINGPVVRFKFNATDSYGLRAETPNITVTFEKDDVLFTILQGSGVTINRSDENDNNAYNFIVIVNDTDRRNVTVNESEEQGKAIRGYFAFSKEPIGPTFDEGHSNTTVNGYLSYYFNPDCNYKTGLQYWKVNISGNTCYKDTELAEYQTFNIIGQLKVNLYLPEKYSQFNVTDNITFKFNTYSDCYLQGKEDNGNISVDVSSLRLNETFYCTPIQQESAGNYNCTWDSTGKPQGNYTVNITVEKLNYNFNTTHYIDWFYLKNRMPNVTSMSVSPSSSGWGDVYTYRAEIFDEENDTVTCSLYTNTTGQWVYKGTTTINTPGNCTIIVNDFNCGEQGQASFMFEVNDTFSRFNTSVASGPLIMKDNVTVTHVLGDNSFVNRSGNQYTTFILNVTDVTKKVKAKNANITIWITTDGNTYQSWFDLQTNESGYAVFNFNPNCTSPEYTLGKQYWIGGVRDDACYNEANTTENFTVNILGDLQLFIIQPKGEKYLRTNYPDGSHVLIKASVYDDCLLPVANARVNFTSEKGLTKNYCNPIYSEGDGNYNCTIDTTTYQAGAWNLTMNASLTNYNYNTTTHVYLPNQKGYWVETKPVIQPYLPLTPIPSGDGGWGEYWVFKTNVTDEDLDTLTLRLWINSTSEPETWTFKASNNSVSGINQTVLFNVTFTSTFANKYFKFKYNVSENVVDFIQNINETGNGTFYLDKDDTFVEYIEGNNTVVNRSATISVSNFTMTVRLWDADKHDTTLGNRRIRFWMTTDNAENWVVVSPATLRTNGTGEQPSSAGWGYASNISHPGCNFAVGPQKWKAEIYNEDPYKSSNSSISFFTIVTSALQSKVVSPKNKTILKGIEDVVIKGNVSDDCGLVANASVTITVIDPSGVVRGVCKPNDQFNPTLDEGNGIYNCTFPASQIYSEDWPTGWYNVTINATKQYYNDSETYVEQDSFRISTAPELSNAIVISEEGSNVGGWGEVWQFSVDIIDPDNDNSTVYLWLNLTGDWVLYNQTYWRNGIDPSTITFYNTFNCSGLASLGTKFFKFNASDNYGYRDEITSSFTLQPDDVEVYVTGTNGQPINREGFNEIELSAWILDIDRDYVPVGEGVNARIRITTNASDPNSWSDFETTTNSSGYARRIIDPDCTYSVGIQTWRAEVYNDACYKTAYDQDTITVVGNIYNSLLAPEQYSSYPTGTLVAINYSTTSDCTNVRSDETPYINVTPTIEISLTGATWEQCSPITNNYGIYNCTWNSSYKPPGYWDIKLTSSKQYYNTKQTVYQDWFEIYNANPTNTSVPTVTPSIGGWGTVYNYSVQLLDTDGDSITCVLYTSTDDGNTWVKQGQQTIGSVGTCSFLVKNFNCNATYTDVGNDNWFKFEITDNYHAPFNISTERGPIIERDNITIILIGGNNSVVNRTGNDFTLLRVFVNDTTKGWPAGNGTSGNVTIKFNITYNGLSYLLDGVNTTYRGNVTYSFNPSCSYHVGDQKWVAYKQGEIGGDQCYNDAMSEIFNLTIIGNLINVIQKPNGEKYNRGEVNVTIRGNVTTDCPSLDGLINNAIVNYTIIHVGTQNTYGCTEGTFMNEGNGYYNCSFDTTSKPTQWYNVRMNSSGLQYYTPNVTTKTNAFFISTPPVLSNPTTTPLSGGWGAPHTFSVYIKDDDNDVNNVSLWIRCVGGGCTPTNFFLAKTTLISASSSPQQVQFTKTDFTPANIGIWEYFFNSTDGLNSANTSINTFTITKDTINLTLIAGNESVINRSTTETAVLRVKVFDVDRNVALSPGEPGTGYFYVTTDPNNPNSYVIDKVLTSIESGSYLTDVFPTLPRCTYGVGPQKWKVEFGSDAYQATNSSEFLINITTHEIILQVIGPNNQTFRRARDPIPLVAQVNDDCGGLVGATTFFKAYPESPWTNCNSPTDNLNGTYNCTLYSPETAGLTYYDVEFNATKQYYNSSSNAYKQDAFVLVTNPEIIAYAPTTSDATFPNGWSEVWNFTASVRDIDQNVYDFEKLNISLWIDFGSGYKLVNSTICSATDNPNCASWKTITFFFNNFTCGDIGIKSYKWNVTDVWNYTNETTSTITIDKSDVIIEFVEQPSYIYRANTSTGKFIYRVYDTDKGQYVTNTSTNTMMWITTDGSNYDSGRFVSINSSGYAVYDFDPDCNYKYGMQKWIAGVYEDACYKNKNLSFTPQFEVRAQLQNNLLTPVYNSIYNVTDMILIRFNTTTECPVEGLIENATTSISLKSPLDVWETCTPINNEYDGWYNCTWNSTRKKEGYWSIMVNSSKTPYFTQNSTIYANWFWLENLNSTFDNITLTPTIGGWSRLYNYTIDIDDPERDDINCSLFISKDNQLTWEYKGSYLLQNGFGTCFVTVHDFACEDIGKEIFYKWQIVNGEPSNAYNTSAYKGPNITESLVQIQLTQGNNTFINRTFQTKPLIVRVLDIENQSYVYNANTSFWITYDYSNYLLVNKTQTDYNGYALYSFTPSCIYQVGTQKWKAGVEDDKCYADVNSSEYLVHVNGTLFNSILHPSGQEFLRGDNVTIKVNVSSDCQNEIMNESVSLQLSIVKDSQNLQCTPVSNENTGMYNCTLNTSSLAARWWNVTAYSSKAGYNSNYTAKINAFWVETKPELNNPTIMPSGDGGWGETWTFTVNFTDEDLDPNTIRLWVNKSSGWSNANTTIVSGINQTIKFVQVNLFTSSDYINSLNNLTKFYFKTQDEVIPTENDTAETEQINITLQKDDVFINHTYGNNIVVNRSGGSLFFRVRMWDTDRVPWDDLPSGSRGRFWFTKDGVTFVNTIDKFANSSGEIAHYQTLDCSFEVGPQKWFAELYGNTPYKDTNSSIFNWTIVTVGLSANITHPDGMPRLRGIDDIVLRVRVTDDCGGVPNATVVFHVPDENYDCTNVYYEGDGYYNCTIPASITASWNTGWHEITAEISKQYYNGTFVEKANAFYLATKPEILLTPPPSAIPEQDGGWGEDWLFTALTQDTDGDIYNVSLWFNLTGEWQLADSVIVSGPQQIEFSGKTFSCENIGERQFMFKVTDVWGYENNYTSPFTIYKDDTIIDYVAGAGTQVDREYNDVEPIIVQISDFDRDGAYVGSNVNGAFFITTDGLNYIQAAANVTDSSSLLSYYFDPNCTFNVGIQRWKAGTYNDACYKDNTPDYGFTIEITGQLKNNLIKPDYGEIIAVGNLVDTTFQVLDECGVAVNDSNGKIEFGSPTNKFEQCLPITDQGNGIYNCTWNTSFHVGGYWDIRLNSSKQYYYSNSTLLNDWIYLLNTPPAYENLSVSPASEGWGREFSFSVDVNDFQYDNVTCTLFVSTDNGLTWKNKGNYTVYGGRGKCIINVSDFNCGDIGSDNRYLFQLYDGTNLINTTNNTNLIIEPNDVEIIYIAGNNSLVNRSGNQYTTFVVQVHDLDANTYPQDVNMSVFVTIDQTNYIANTTPKSGMNGMLYYNFNPSCTFNELGMQYWLAGADNNVCYKSTNTTQNYTVYIIGNVLNRLTSPTGQDFLRGEDNITFTIETSDDCGAPVENAHINLTLISEYGNAYGCDPIEEFGGGVYYCTKNTTGMKARWYNVTINTSKDFFNTNVSLHRRPFFIKTMPIVQNLTITPAQDWGWGERYTFTANVTDEDLDTVYVNLYYTPVGFDDWIQINSTTIDSPINTTVVLTYQGFTCSDIDYEQEFEFTVLDNRSYLVNSSLYEPWKKKFNLTKDDVQIIYEAGNGEEVWRNGTDSRRLSVRIYDTDKGNYPGSGYNGMFWVTTNYTQFDIGKPTTTNSSSFLNYYFTSEAPQPECDYSTGVQVWKAGIYDDACYKDINSTNYTIIIKSELRPQIDYPYGQGFIRPNPVPFVARIYDDCGLVSGATTTWTAYNGPNEYGCTNKTEADGWYNCTWPSANRPYGYYHLQFAATKNYYAPNSTYRPNAYFLGTLPQLSDPKILNNHYLGGWGETYEFSVKLTDFDLNTNNVSVWKSFDAQNWTLVASQNVSNAVNQQVIFPVKFNCSDMGLNYFYFTSVDQFGYSTNTTILNFTLEADNVTLSIGLINTTVRRMGERQALLNFTIYDDDYGRYAPNALGNINITLDYSNYSYVFNCTTNARGECSVYYNPNCSSLVGVQKWIGKTVDSCYQVKETSPVSLTVVGQLNTSIVNPYNGQILNRNQHASLNATILDECFNEVSGAIALWYNETWSNIASGYNTTWIIPTYYELGPETIYLNVSKTYYDPNGNSTDVYIYGWSGVSILNPPNSSFYLAGTSVNVKCKVTDLNTTMPLQSYMVKFYKNGTLMDAQLTNSDGEAFWLWQTMTENYGWYNITCSIDDNTVMYYNASISSATSLVEIKRPLIIQSIDKSSQFVYRNDSFEPNNVNITVRVKDSLIGDAQNANVTFYNSTALIDWCLTNETGQCYITFNPADTLTPNIYTIYVNATKLGLQDSATNITTIEVKGKLFVNISSPANNSFWAKTDNIALTAYVYDESAQPTTASIKWFNETAQVAYGENTNWYLIEQTTGNHTLIANATRDYYDKGEQTIIITISSLSNVQWVYPSDGSIMPYPDAFNTLCRVVDSSTGTPIPNYMVQFWYNYTPGYIFNGTLYTNDSGIATNIWQPTQKGQVMFRCNITNDYEKLYTANIKEAFALITIRDIRPPQINNISIEPYDGLEANLNYTNISAIITDDIGVYQAWAQVTMPNATVLNLTMIASGNTYSVLYLPPIGGNYSVRIYARDYPPEINSNNTFAGIFYVNGKTNGIITQPDSIQINGITWTNSESAELTINFTNIGPATAYAVNVSFVSDPPTLVLNETIHECGTIYNQSS
ncbi:MAG: hypothetical protein QXM38_02680, partial [Candidatus Aenigmatarchaeota archaeon]